MLDVTTLIGMLVGVLLLGAAALSGGRLAAFLDLPSALIVLGGTVAATLVNYPLRHVAGLPRILKIALLDRHQSPEETITQLVGFAEKARREGLLAMEEEADAVEDEFLRKGLQLVVDGADAELVRNIMEIELAFLEERHKAGQRIFESMGALSPAFGMIGTLIGLIQMLGALDDPEAIGPGMALALITTLYGALLANLVFNPVAGKLRVKSEEEILLKEVMIEGILSIQAGENPRMVEQKLRAFLSPGSRRRRTREGAPAEMGRDPVVTSGAR